MRFLFCPNCGQRLHPQEIGDEGPTPYCENCVRPWFDMFSCSIIALIENEEGEIALLKQRYISDAYLNLVSGYMKPGESAEEAARREIREELGLDVLSLKLTRTYWFEKKGILMIGFFAKAEKAGFVLSREVDDALWVKAERALALVHPEGSVSHAVVKAFLERSNL